MAAPFDQVLLAALFPIERIRAALVPRPDWRPYPLATDRAAWRQLPTETRKDLVREAEAHLGEAWPPLPATLFMEYARTDNRSHYEARHFARRNALQALLLGECAEGQGRFVDDIVNGIWAICEESFWGVPAHASGPRDPIPSLPDTAHPYVDLFAAETGALLAWTSYLLAGALAEAAPAVLERIAREVGARLLRPYREIDDWWWLGRVTGPAISPINNWNPWIHANILACDLLLETDDATRAATVHRALEGLDAFLATYPPDGGCDEGTTYWERAGGSLFDCLDLLASGGALDAFALPLVREIGRYIVRMHIGGPWYVNFSDGAAKIAPDSALLYHFGQRIGDRNLMRQAAEAQRHAGTSAHTGSIQRKLAALCDPIPPAITRESAPLLRNVWLPGTQVMVAREHGGSTKGLLVAAKGGHNGEGHNHNDVGQFIVALDGRPVVIDPGVGTYTRQTFGPDRYAVWTMQSANHNLPVVNGVQRHAGKEYCACDVTYTIDGGNAEVCMDLAAAYPTEAGVERWDRVIRLERGASPRVILQESWLLAEEPTSLALHLMLAFPMQVVTPGRVRCSTPTRPLIIAYDAGRFVATVEPILLTDARLSSVWGERISRVALQATEPERRGGWTVTFSPEG